MLGLSIRTALFDCELEIAVRAYLAYSVSDLYIRIRFGDILAAKAKVHGCMARVPPLRLEPFAMLVVLRGKKLTIRTLSCTHCTCLICQEHQHGMHGSSIKNVSNCGVQSVSRDPLADSDYNLVCLCVGMSSASLGVPRLEPCAMPVLLSGKKPTICTHFVSFFAHTRFVRSNSVACGAHRSRMCPTVGCNLFPGTPLPIQITIWCVFVSGCLVQV